jgi:hypothetical protein
MYFSTLYADVKELAFTQASAQQATPLFDRRLRLVRVFRLKPSISKWCVLLFAISPGPVTSYWHFSCA